MCEFLEQSICTRASLLVSGAETQIIVKIFQLDFFFSGFQVSFSVGGIFFFFFDSDFYKKFLFLWTESFQQQQGNFTGHYMTDRENALSKFVIWWPNGF